MFVLWVRVNMLVAYDSIQRRLPLVQYWTPCDLPTGIYKLSPEAKYLKQNEIVTYYYFVKKISGDDAKTLLLKFRGSYRDAGRWQLRCMKSGTASENINSCRFQNQMSFHDPFMSTGLGWDNSSRGAEFISPYKNNSLQWYTAKSPKEETRHILFKQSLDWKASEMNSKEICRDLTFPVRQTM